MNTNIKTVSQYITNCPKNIQPLLKKLRATIKTNAKQAIESISYGMPTYKLNGKPLVYFGGYKTHIGFYATPTGNLAFKKDLTKYNTSKGTIRLPLDKPLPLALIKKIVKFRIKEVSKK